MPALSREGLLQPGAPPPLGERITEHQCQEATFVHLSLPRENLLSSEQNTSEALLISGVLIGFPIFLTVRTCSLTKRIQMGSLTLAKCFKENPEKCSLGVQFRKRVEGRNEETYPLFLCISK